MQKTKKLYTGESLPFSSSQLELPDRTLLHGPLDVGSQDSKAEREEGLIELHGWICITSWKEERGGGRPMAAEEEEEKSPPPLVAETQGFFRAP